MFAPVPRKYALGLVAIGVACVIGFSWILTLIVPTITISFVENAELASRISPGLYALLTALGSGAAGAYITSRREIADSMGGVAIAISLVPPLCVVGIALSQGNWDAATGAMLLFVTNFLAILLAGGLIFLLCGLGWQATAESHSRVRRGSFIAVIAATLLVAIPLSFTAYQTVTSALENRTATVVVKRWLEGTHLEMIGLNTDDETVTVNVEGTGELRPLSELANELSSRFERPIVVKVRVVPSYHETSGR